jgi:hypothetical protein
MKCPLCDIEAVITKTRQAFNMEEQKLFRYIEFSCRNKKCPNFEKVIGEDKDELPVTIE